MATIPISSGVTSNLILSSGDILNVYNSGKVVGATVKKGATMNVYSGGSVYSTYVTSSGSAIFRGSGSGATLRINAGGFMWVSSGGYVVNVVVDSNGYLEARDGVASGITILKYGELMVSSGGVAREITLSGASADLWIRTGGMVNIVTVSGGAVSTVKPLLPVVFSPVSCLEQAETPRARIEHTTQTTMAADQSR